jgi:hypothetical protein
MYSCHNIISGLCDSRLFISSVNEHKCQRTYSTSQKSFWNICSQFWFLKNTVFWVVTPCSSVKVRGFGGTYRFHLGVRRRSQTRNLQNRVGSLLDPEDESSLFLWNLGLRATRPHSPKTMCTLHSYGRDVMSFQSLFVHVRPTVWVTLRARTGCCCWCRTWYVTSCCFNIRLGRPR